MKASIAKRLLRGEAVERRSGRRARMQAVCWPQRPHDARICVAYRTKTDAMLTLLHYKSSKKGEKQEEEERSLEHVNMLSFSQPAPQQLLLCHSKSLIGGLGLQQCSANDERVARRGKERRLRLAASAASLPQS